MRYVVLFPSGKSLVFYIQSVAEMYVTAYNGVLISNPTECMVMKESALQ